MNWRDVPDPDPTDDDEDVPCPGYIAAVLGFDPDYPVENSFCPTGKGGGVDPSCGKSAAVGDTVIRASDKRSGKVVKIRKDHVVVESVGLKLKFFNGEYDVSASDVPTADSELSAVDVDLKPVDKPAKAVADTFKKLTAKQRYAVAVHTGSEEGSGIMDEGDRLRDGERIEDLPPGKGRDTMEALHSAIQEFPEPVTTYRGISSAQVGIRGGKWVHLGAGASHKLRPPTDTDIKEEKLRAEFVRNLDAAAKSGGTITMNGFTSTSISPAVAVEFAYDGGPLFEIKQKRGVWAVPNSEYKYQLEIIADHGAKYRVTEKSEKTVKHPFSGEIQSRTVYHLEEL